MKPRLKFPDLAALLLAACMLTACASGPQQSAAPTNQPTILPSAGATPAAVLTGTIPAGEFTNPVIQTNFPDPFLLKVGNTWYAYATNGSGRNVQVTSSTDLTHWNNFADAMPTLASWTDPITEYVWAPEVLPLDDKYVLYYTAHDKQSGKQCVGVAVSNNPEGKFTDPNNHALVCQAQEGGTIDPDPFRDGDKLYLLFKNDGNCCGQPTYIFSQELAPDGLSLVGEPKALLRNDRPWEGQVIEAPTMLKHEGRYYLFFSANNYAGPEYGVGYATCDGPTGPCTDAPENPILNSRVYDQPPVIGPGHQTIIQVGDQYWMVYHAWQVTAKGARTDNRFMYIDRLNWVNGKPVVPGPTTHPQPMPQP